MDAKVSASGQITLPLDLQEQTGIGTNNDIVLEAVNNTIVIRPKLDFFAYEGFLGKRLSRQEEKQALYAAVERRMKGLPINDS